MAAALRGEERVQRLVCQIKHPNQDGLRHGLTLGKFMPLHRGHQFLFDFARRYVDELTILVCSLDDDPMPGALRYDWVRRSNPDCRVVHVTDELPQTPDDDPQFYQIWKALVERETPRGLDVFFSSETYGSPFAGYLGVDHVPVDIDRINVPVSASNIRDDPFGNWRYISRVARPYFLKRICLFGPESTGKSTLANRLAQRFQTAYVPEYARAYLNANDGHCDLCDIDAIARGQAALEEAAAFNANKLLFCETDILHAKLWGRILFGECAPWIKEPADRGRYDLYFLINNDDPMTDSGQRYFPDRERRQRFYRQCEATLKETQRPYIQLSGTWREQEAVAVQSIRKRFGL